MIPVFDPLPVPPFEIPERIRDREEAARAQAADLSSHGTTTDSTPSRRSTSVPVQAPVPARVWVLVEGQVQEWTPPAKTPAPVEKAPVREPVPSPGP